MMTKTCLGIDISGDDMKLVELRRSGKSFEVLQAVRVKLGAAKNVGAELRQFIAETSTFPSVAVWSVPGSECSIKFANVPKTKPAETARMARYEAESQIPLPLSDLMWGYTVDKQQAGDELSHLMIGAARRDFIEGRLADLDEAELPLTSALISPLAGVTSSRRSISADSSPYFVINIGSEWTDLTAVDGERIIACRSLHLGISSLAAAIAADRKMETSDALEMLYTEGIPASTSGSESEESAVQRWLDGLCLEIRRSALSSMASLDGRPMQTALLTGEGSEILHLTEAICGRAGLSVEIGNPWTGMTVSNVANHQAGDAPAVFSVATGLALSGLSKGDLLDLMPSERAEERLRQRKQRGVLATMGAAAVMLLVVLLSGYAGIGSRSQELDALKQQTTSVKRHVHSLRPVMLPTVTTMRKVVDGLEDRGDSPVEILRRLSIGLPKSCWLTEFRYEEGKTVTLRGNALSNSAVADAVYVLSNRPEFEKVSLDYSNLGRNGTSPVYDFQIKCDLPAKDSLLLLSRSAKEKKSKKEGVIAR